MKRGLALMTVLFTMTAGFALAEVPHKISFQGYVSSLSGNPISGRHIFTFTMYNAQTGGNSLWTDSDSLALDKGQFNAYLGEHTALPDSIFTGQLLWLETAVDGSVLPARQPLVSVAYSFRAQRADTAMVALAGGDKGPWETDGTNVYRAEGNVGIGTVSPRALLHIGPGAPSPVTATSQLMVQTVDEGAQLAVRCAHPTSFARIWYETGTGSFGNSWNVGIRADQSLGNGFSFESGRDGFWSSKLFVTQAGNIGVGTTNPSERLEVSNGRILVSGSSDGDTGKLILASLLVPNHGWAWQALDNGSFELEEYNVSNGRVVVTMGGNFGINTYTPSAKLNVVGSTKLEGDVQVTGNLCVNGQKNAVVPTSQGMIKVYSEESAEVWFTDYGRAHLTGGKCHVDLSPLFLETVTISTEHPLMVFLQEEEECNGLIAVPGLTGLDVIEKGKGRSNACFSYRIVAKRKYMENVRLELIDN
jgi:hypothetical protein